MVHVWPLNDTMQHKSCVSCACWPEVEFFDPATGKHWTNGPIVKHNAQDGRDVFEKHGFKSGKKWMSAESGGTVVL